MLRPQARTILKTRFVNHGVKEVFSLLIVHGFDNSSHFVAFLRLFFRFRNPGQRFPVCCFPLGTILLHVALFLALEASSFIFKFVILGRPFLVIGFPRRSCINLHWYHVALLLSFESILEVAVPLVWSRASEYVPLLSEGFLDNSEASDFSVGCFFPIVNGCRPCVTP